MALIRSRIGKFDVKTRQIKEAKVCWGLAFVATIAAIIGAPLLLSWFFDNPVFLGVVWIIWFGVTLILIIGLNIVIRIFSTGQVA